MKFTGKRVTFLVLLVLAWGLPDYLIAVSANVQGVQAVPPNTLDQGRFDKVWLA